MRTIAVISVGRSDYGLYRPILRRIVDDRDLRLQLVAAAAHLSPEFGRTVSEIEEDGFVISARVEMLVSSDTPEGTGKSMGLGLIGFSQLFAATPPDMILVLGDRFEMLSAVVAAAPFKIPVAHIHGGETTEGAIDEGFRHAITKMSHLHFVATEAYARRVIQMGEAPWRVLVTGAPGLDNVRELDLMSSEEIHSRLGVGVSAPFLLVTHHSSTLQEQTSEHIESLLQALDRIPLTVVFTYPNADPGSRTIIDRIHSFAAEHSGTTVVPHAGTRGYFSLMRHAQALVGNSSSGLIEAAAFELPVVNVGDRQKGRVRPANVIDTSAEPQSIERAIRRALSSEFRSGLCGLVNPYGDGHAASRIVERLKAAAIDPALLMKSFHDA